MSLAGALRSFASSSPARRIPSLLFLRAHVLPSHSPMASATTLRSAPFPSTICRSLINAFFSTYSPAASFADLTDTRFQKRRPDAKPRRKRASLKPPGPYAWVQYVPGEPIPRSRPNEGSVKGRNRKKRIKQRKSFILSEKKKRKAQYAEARKKRDMERIERKMAAVAREKAWAERLIELQQLEKTKKATMA